MQGLFSLIVLAANIQSSLQQGIIEPRVTFKGSGCSVPNATEVLVLGDTQATTFYEFLAGGDANQTTCTAKFTIQIPEDKCLTELDINRTINNALSLNQQGLLSTRMSVNGFLNPPLVSLVEGHENGLVADDWRFIGSVDSGLCGGTLTFQVTTDLTVSDGDLNGTGILALVEQRIGVHKLEARPRNSDSLLTGYGGAHYFSPGVFRPTGGRSTGSRTRSGATQAQLATLVAPLLIIFYQLN